MKFNLFANNELIGYSALEGADPSMGIRSGRFVPHKNYSKYQSLFRNQSQIRLTPHVNIEPPDAYKKLRKQLDSLSLRVETDAGETIGTMFIDIEDFSEELGEEGYELSIVVDERHTYEKFFE